MEKSIIKNNIKSIYDSENGKSQVIQGEDGIIFQVTNAKNELELLQSESVNNQVLSILDLGQCEMKLKNEYNINDNDSLIYLKQENISSETSEKKIEYEVYEPYNFTKLNLSICDGENINIYVKLHLSEETKAIYENLKSMGFNMFNINDPFYQDICITYKSENNTDIILSDRINYIYNNKDSKCQSNCEFSSYLPNSLYLNCSCIHVEENNKEKTKFSGKKIYESFYDVLKYSNYKILKCYELVFKKNPFKKTLVALLFYAFFHFIAHAW